VTVAAGLCRCAVVGLVVVAGRDLDVAGKHRGQQPVEARCDVPGEPAFAARRAFLHGYAEYDRDLAIAFGCLGSPHGYPSDLVTTFAAPEASRTAIPNGNARDSPSPPTADRQRRTSPEFVAPIGVEAGA
jgi:hypothetical protein